MAHMIKGLMGGFTGRVGDMIGFYRNGKHYVRKAPKKRTGAPSRAQSIQQERFSMMTKFLAPVRSFMNDVHKNVYRRENRYYKLFSLNYNEALTGEYPDFSIDYKKLCLTSGSLLAFRGVNVSYSPDTFVDIHWEDLSEYYWSAQRWDRLYLVFYNEDKKYWDIRMNAALREDLFVSTDLRIHTGNNVHVYAGFISADKRQISNSRYLGMINIK